MFNYIPYRSGEAHELSDWPLVRPAGPEPESLGFIDGLSNNERHLLVIGGVAAAAWLLFRGRR